MICYGPCGQDKPCEEFGKCKRELDGYKRICKLCTKNSHTKWRKANPQKVREHTRLRHEKRRNSVSIGDYRSAVMFKLMEGRAAAKKKGYSPCNIQTDTLAFNELVASFTTVCQFCTVDVESAAICLDHDHVTGVFRNWLCNCCNLIRSRYEKNPEHILHTLRNADLVISKLLES